MSLVLEGVAVNIGGRPLVKDISLTMDPSEVVGLLGPNGAGKTTTFNLIIGLLRPDLGKVILDDSYISKFSMSQRARLGIGYLPQEPSVFRQLTVRENLDIALASIGLYGSSYNYFDLRKLRRNLTAGFYRGTFNRRFNCFRSCGKYFFLKN